MVRIAEDRPVGEARLHEVVGSSTFPVICPR
jgi:hypothetical protein